MILGLRHTGIVVRDMNKSLEFYRDFLGLTPVVDCVEEGSYIDTLFALKNVRVRIVKLIVKAGSAAKSQATGLPVGQDGVVELLQFLSPVEQETAPATLRKTGVSHLAFAVDDVEKIYAEWKKKNVLFNEPPGVSPDGVAKVTYAHDPDGTPIELVQILK